MRLDRLRRMSREEVRWRGTVAVRTAAQRLASHLVTLRWRRRDLTRVLAPDALDDGMRAAVHAGRWDEAHARLETRLRGRRARFVLDHAAHDTVRNVVLARWPSALQDAVERAERILHDEHDILGYRGLKFAADGREIDWHFDPVHNRRAPRAFSARVPYLDPVLGDHKVIWEINRHQYWMRLGRAAWLANDPRFARAIVAHLEGWLAANPPLVGINWASMLEIGFRAMSWTWALHCLLGFRASDRPALGPAEAEDAAAPAGKAWLVDMLIGLDRQLTHVEQNLSYYFSPNTHLTGEALALYVVGTALPDLAASSRWAATGRRILLTEIERQILPDGGHAERSSHYQRYTLDFYLLALQTARLAADQEAAARFGDAAARLAEFTRLLADDEGRLPLLGDDDGGMLWPLTGRGCSDARDSLAVAAALLDRPEFAPWGPTEEVVWIAGPEAVTRAESPASPLIPSVRSQALPDTGYFIARDDRGSHAVLDAGAHGYMNGGHAHADALSLTLTLRFRPLLIDPGTSTYTIDPTLRDRMRSSMSHNTITVDGRSQSTPAGPFHWHTRADARLEDWRHNERFDWAEGSHDGYAPVRHRRSLVRSDGGGWLVVDEILGRGTHSAQAHWHFDPSWMVTVERGRLRAMHGDGAIAWLLHDGGEPVLFQGDDESGLGWYAPVYGTLVPAWTARMTTEATAPLALVTWIGEGRDWGAPALRRVAAQSDSTSPAIAAEVVDGKRAAVFMLRPGGAPPHAARTCRVADYETDATVLHYIAQADRLLSIAVVDARHVVTTRAGWVSIDAEEAIRDLHVTFENGTMDLRASTPPPDLRVRGATTSHTVRLNGRELPLDMAIVPATLPIRPADWPANFSSLSPTRPWRHSGAAFADH